MDLSINYFDAARAYRLCEERLGEAGETVRATELGSRVTALTTSEGRWCGNPFTLGGTQTGKLVALGLWLRRASLNAELAASRKLSATRRMYTLYARMKTATQVGSRNGP